LFQTQQMRIPFNRPTYSRSSRTISALPVTFEKSNKAMKAETDKSAVYTNPPPSPSTILIQSVKGRLENNLDPRMG
jgi:hypothetical protein